MSAIVLPAVKPSTTPATTEPVTVPTTAPVAEVPHIEPTNPKLLRALLPHTVSTLKRGDVEAGMRSIGEMRSSLAQAPYGDEADPTHGHANVKIVDYAAMPGLIESVAPWQTADVSKGTNTEYTRTTSVGAYRALEAYAHETKSGSINILVGKRYVVTVEVTGLSAETLRQTADAMKLDDLAAIAE